MSFDETAWWGTCANTWHEEQKQFACARRMGLQANWACAHPPTFDLGGRSVIDIGGGPVSLLLKCENAGRMVVADPAKFPDWVTGRYDSHGIEYWMTNGEDISGYTLDEAWLYNVLQHVIDPAKVIAVARELTSTIRVFEWIDIEPYDGHPHMLTENFLNDAFGAKGFTARIDEEGAVGRAYYGVFQGT